MVFDDGKALRTGLWNLFKEDPYPDKATMYGVIIQTADVEDLESLYALWPEAKEGMKAVDEIYRKVKL